MRIVPLFNNFSREVHSQGFALVAALLLVVVVGITATTVLQTTSTELKISGNQRQAVQDFYAAEAGLAEGQARLRKRAGAEHVWIVDRSQRENPFWSAYILTSSTWSLNDDPKFSSHDTNLIPLPGNPVNTIVQPNSVQSTIPYWVKLRHKTEYDAEQAGHHTRNSHYLDGDGQTLRHRSTNVGNIIQYGYPSLDATAPVPFTTQGVTPWFPIELIAAYGGADVGGVLLEIEAIHPVGPNHQGALSVEGDVILSGQPGTINGDDACGVGAGLPPIRYGGSLTNTASIQFEGNPASPQISQRSLNLETALNDLRARAGVLHTDQNHQQLGTADVPMVFLAEREAFVQPGGIQIRQTNGHGILLVNGNARLEGEVQWRGMILVTGALILRGQGNGILIQGGVWAGHVDYQSGLFTINYDSCQIQTALLSVPVKMRTWKENF